VAAARLNVAPSREIAEIAVPRIADGRQIIVLAGASSGVLAPDRIHIKCVSTPARF